MKDARPTEKKKKEGRDRLAYLDFDGEKLNPGKNYKDYKREDRAKKKAFKNPCKHRRVAVTMRCASGCHEVKVYFRRGMIK